MSLWAIDPLSGVASCERVTRPVPNALSRDFLCLAFTPYAEKQWLYGGTASGDIVIAHTRSRAVYHSVFCSGGGVTSLLVVPAASHAPAPPAGAVDYGGTPRNDGGVWVVAGAGDGTLTIYHHSVTTIEQDLVLAAAVSASTSGASSATRPSLSSRTFVAVRAVRLEGAVWSLTLLNRHAFSTPAAVSRAGGGLLPPTPVSATPSLDLAVGTSSGMVYRVREAPTGNTLNATVVSHSHAALGEELETATAPALALAATPGITALPAQLITSALIGGVTSVAFAPGASDFYVRSGSPRAHCPSHTVNI